MNPSKFLKGQPSLN